jgi:hypothetical protein
MTTGIVTVGARKTTRGAVNAAAPEKGGGLSAFQRSASEGRFFFFASRESDLGRFGSRTDRTEAASAQT